MVNHLDKRLRRIKFNYELYLLLLPMLLYFIIFHYGPLYGILIAFKNYMPVKGILGSPWAGFTHFSRFFHSYQFWSLIKNTLGLSFFNLAVNFPVPIILALSLNQVEKKYFKKLVQTVTYAPHFISTVVLVGILFIFLSPRSGVVNQVLTFFGGEEIFFMGKPEWFRPLYVLSAVWQNAGWSSIIYLAALTNIDVSLHEASVIDGASKLQRIWYIEIPGIMPTAVVMLILNVGKVMDIGFEKAYLMQTSLNLDASEIISTYVYKIGLINSQFSFSTAVGLFNSLINLVLIVLVNRIARKISETSLW